MPAHVRVSGVWRKTLASVRVAGAWRSVPQIYVKIGGAWRALYSYAWSLGGWGGCSASCGGGTQTRSVTCARNDGVTVDDAVCLKLVGAKPATSQPCNTQSCITCRYDTKNRTTRDCSYVSAGCSCSVSMSNCQFLSGYVNGAYYNNIESKGYTKGTCISCYDYYEGDCNSYCEHRCSCDYEICGQF